VIRNIPDSGIPIAVSVSTPTEQKPKSTKYRSMQRRRERERERERGMNSGLPDARQKSGIAEFEKIIIK